MVFSDSEYPSCHGCVYRAVARRLGSRRSSFLMQLSPRFRVERMAFLGHTRTPCRSRPQLEGFGIRYKPPRCPPPFVRGKGVGAVKSDPYICHSSTSSVSAAI